MIRAVNALFMMTYFDPDEYWQTIEVAHRQVFGYGWLTWEWRVGLRSYLYLVPFMAYFWMLKIFKLDEHAILLVFGPKLLQAVMAATVDYLTYQLALRVSKNRKVAEASLFLSLVNYFNLAYATRTISNNFESLLTLITVLHWPIEETEVKTLRLIYCFLLIGLNVLNRPSSVIQWLVPIILLFYRNLCGVGQRLRVLLSVLFLIPFVISIGILIDMLFYKRFMFSWWNFFKVNVMEKVSEFYGISSWHYHFTTSLPTLLGSMIPLVVLSLLFEQYSVWILQFLISSLLFNSMLAHKEIRFVYPLMPYLMVLAGQGYRILVSATIATRLRWFTRIYLLFMLLTNVGIGIYLARYHQSGVIRVMDHLREEADKGSLQGIYFAMPCHSTPFQGYLHRPWVAMNFVTCEPPLDGQSSKDYLDESDRFYKDPAAYLYKHLPTSTTHLVMYEELLERSGVCWFLQSRKLKECYRIFNSHFNADRRRTGDVLVYCRD